MSKWPRRVCETPGCTNEVPRARSKYCRRGCFADARRIPVKTCERSGCDKRCSTSSARFCSQKCRWRKYNVGGRYYSLGELAELTGISYNTLMDRVREVEVSVSEELPPSVLAAPRGPERIKLGGVLMTVEEAARIAGCSTNTINQRMKRGEVSEGQEAPRSFFRPANQRAATLPEPAYRRPASKARSAATDFECIDCGRVWSAQHKYRAGQPRQERRCVGCGRRRHSNAMRERRMAAKRAGLAQKDVSSG